MKEKKAPVEKKKKVMEIKRVKRPMKKGEGLEKNIDKDKDK